MKVFLDGSNLLLNVTLDGKPSCFLFASIFASLTLKGYDCSSIIDQSIRYRLDEKGAASEWPLLEKLVQASSGSLVFVPESDPPLITMALETNAYVANHSDRYRKEFDKFGKLPPLIRVTFTSGVLSVNFTDNPSLTYAETLGNEVELFGTKLTPQGVIMNILAPESPLSQSLEARLIVFALDASGSMSNEADGARNTFDRRMKSEHLSEVLKTTIARFGECNVRDSFYVSVMNFAGNVHVHEMAGAKMAHYEHAAKHIASSNFNYLRGVSGNGTNIALALNAATELIDLALVNPKNKELATDWHALIVLITDGKDTNDREAVLNQAGQIAVQRGHLKFGRVRIATVAIGNECDLDLLQEISSGAENDEVGRFQKAGLLQYLLPAKDSQKPCLSLHVDTGDKNYKDMIRLFIDVASTTVV